MWPQPRIACKDQLLGPGRFLQRVDRQIPCCCANRGSQTQDGPILWGSQVPERVHWARQSVGSNSSMGHCCAALVAGSKGDLWRGDPISLGSGVQTMRRRQDQCRRDQRSGAVALAVVASPVHPSDCGPWVGRRILNLPVSDFCAARFRAADAGRLGLGCVAEGQAHAEDCCQSKRATKPRGRHETLRSGV